MSEADPRGRRPVRAILLALGAYAVWTAMDVIVKLVADRYHTFQLIAMNSAVSALVVIAPVAMKGAWHRLRTARPWLQLARGLLFGVTLAGIYWGLARLPIADVYALLFTIPLLVSALSVPMHKAEVSWRRWGAILAGFVGVLVMLRPGGDLFAIASLVVLGAALCEALALLTIRWFPPDETAEAMTVWPFVVMVPFGAAGLPWVGVVPALGDLPILLAAGICGGVGTMLVTQAHREGAAATVAPFQYSQMPYGIVVGLLLFDDVPEATMLLGAAIVVASGLYILREEARNSRVHAASQAAAHAGLSPDHS